MRVLLPAVQAWLMCLWLVGLGAANAQASDEATGELLSLQEVLDSVESHHPLLVAQLSAVDEAAAESLAARGAFDPELTVKGHVTPLGYYDYNNVDAAVEQRTPLWGTRLHAGYRLSGGNIPDYFGELDTLDRGEVRAGLTIPLWKDRAVDEARAGRRSADALLEAAQWEQRVALLDLWEAAAAAYFDWVAAARGRNVHRALLELSRTRASQIAGKVESGALAPIAQLDNQRALLSREAKLVAAQRKLEQAAIKLSMFLRDDGGDPRVARDAHGEPLRTPPVARDLDDAATLQRALEEHPLVSHYEARVREASVQLELAANQVAPQLDLLGEASRDFGTGDADALTTLGPTVVKAGAVLKVPLGLRKARGKRDAKRAKLAALEAKASYARDRVRASVQDAASALRNAVERVDRTRQAAEVAEKLAEGERTRFELGATTLIWVTLREKAAADALLDAVQALADANVAWVSYQVALAERPKGVGAVRP